MSASTSHRTLSHSRSLRAPHNVPKAFSITTATPSLGPSNISLFLTNLRLLGLESREDWPEIDALTFSTKDSQHNYKKRIQCVEWALYQLFVIWDPQEARSKLQPFYPPLEPLQSLNLRNALFRSLEQMKKNGMLSQDTVLRKTMFDECKGERLEEVLAVFSNVVLKKVVQQKFQNKHKPLAQQLALENSSYKGERTILSSLIFAHRASLMKNIREKDNARAKYRDFSNLLNLTERKIAQRYEQLRLTADSNSSQVRTLEKYTKEVQDWVSVNWSGDPEWAKEIFFENMNEHRCFLSTQFDEIWSHIVKGTISDVEDQFKLGLLDQLDNRIQGQENRLARWQDFGKSLGKSCTIVPVMKSHVTNTERTKADLGFTKHQSLHLGYQSSENPLSMTSRPSEDYTQLLEKMRLDLIAVGRADVQTHTLSISGQVYKDLVSVNSQATKLDGSEPKNMEDWGSTSNPGSDTGLCDIVDKDSSLFQVSESHVNIELQREEAGRKEETSSKDEDPSKKTLKTSAQLTETAAQLTYPVSQVKSLDSLDISRLEAKSDLDLANQILNMVSSSSPSPRKTHVVLSLAERTRMSMARTAHSRHPDAQESEVIKSSSSPKKLRSLSIPKTSNVESELELGADLTQRTRMSMVGIEAAQKKAQLDRQRSLKAATRQQREYSYFAKDEVSTPVDVSAMELIEGNPDYESVFKSRPKIKTSPTICPNDAWEYQEMSDTGENDR
ncbi:hypothetical protein K3495_g12463 [Podosphaera aphanis]|nr:hypothetical protein K3495_g12463 [Podosphaera aphanis]